MSEQIKKETTEDGFERKFDEAIKAGNPDQLMALLVKTDETLLQGRILESMYRRPSVSRENLQRELASFIQEAQSGSAHYLFNLTGGMDRMSIIVENGGVSIEMTGNTSPETKNKWEEIK